MATCKVEGCLVPEHTPGQWRVEFDAYGGYDMMSSAYLIQSGETRITEVDTGHKGKDVESAANAALIARAPDLAHALVGLVKALNAVVNIDQADTLQTAPLWLKVRAALAAAEKALAGQP